MNDELKYVRPHLRCPGCNETIDNGWLHERLETLATAIRKHRDQRGDDRCWLDDNELYAVLGEPEDPQGSALPDRATFLANCARFHATRQASGVGPTGADKQGRWVSATKLHQLPLPDLQPPMGVHDSRVRSLRIHRKFRIDDYVIARALTKEELVTIRERRQDPYWEDWYAIGLRMIIENHHIEPHTISYGCIVIDETSPYHRREIWSFDEERLSLWRE